MKLGATDGVDPNQYTAAYRLNPNHRWHQRRYCTKMRWSTIFGRCARQKTDRTFAGRQNWSRPRHRSGRRRCLWRRDNQAVGGIRARPDGHDRAVTDLAARLSNRDNGLLQHRFSGRRHDPNSSEQLADGAKHFQGGTCGGTNPRRDVPRYVRLMEAGKLDMKSMAQKTYPLKDTTEAYRVAMNRTVVATIVTPNAWPFYLRVRTDKRRRP